MGARGDRRMADTTAHVKQSRAIARELTAHLSAGHRLPRFPYRSAFYFAMFHYLAYNDVIQIPPDPS